MASSYSVWASPKGKLGDQLQAEIQRLGRDYKTPSFPPHVTLVGGATRTREEAVATTKAVASKLKGFDIEFVKVAYKDTRYQCVFILCGTDMPVMEAAAALNEAFGENSKAIFMPHLSLLYSGITQEQRQQLAQKEQARLFDGIHGDQHKLCSNRFSVDRIGLWYTPMNDPTLASWRLVEEFKLQAENKLDLDHING